MFNVLSGLQEGSRSVVVVSRASNGATFVKGDVVVTSGGKLSAAGAADAMFLEFVFEDLTGNSSGKYTVIYGSMEAETDNIDDTGSGAGSARIAELNPQLQVIGVDINQTSVAIATENHQLSNLQFIVGDIEQNIFAQARLKPDVFLNSASWHHVSSFNNYQKENFIFHA